MNIILTKILLTNAHHRHRITHLHTTYTNATNVGANPLPLPVLGKSVIAAKNQSGKSVTNAANLTVAVNVKDIVGVKDTANLKDAVSRIAKLIAKLIASTNPKRNRVSA